MNNFVSVPRERFYDFIRVVWGKTEYTVTGNVRAQNHYSYLPVGYDRTKAVNEYPTNEQIEKSIISDSTESSKITKIKFKDMNINFFLDADNNHININTVDVDKCTRKGGMCRTILQTF